MGWKEMLKERKEKKASQNVKTFKVPDGKTLMRILPNKDDPDAPFFHDFGQHWIKSSDKNAQGQNQIVAAPLCLKRAYDKECPYCEAISQALGEIEDNAHLFDDDEIELIKGAKSRQRFLVNAAVRQSRTGDYNIEVVELPSTAFDALVNVMDEWGEEILSPKGGKDIVVERTGTGINTKYTVTIPKNGGSDIADDWVDEVTDLEAFVRAQEVTSERHNRSIETIGKLAKLDMAAAAPAIEHKAPERAEKSAIESKPAPRSTVVTDSDLNDLDALEEALDDVPFEADEPIAVEVEVEESSGTNPDDDLLAELDELENL